MKNENCLEGMRCPACHHSTHLIITVKTDMKVFDDGTDEHSDTIWDDHSPCQCPECGTVGRVFEFREDWQERQKASKHSLTREDQEQFLIDFMDDMRDKLVANSKLWPEDWSGVEMKGLVKKAMDWEYAGPTSGALSRQTKRGKNFNNTWTVENLYR